jgi:predicted transcriptional regulator
MLQYSVAMRPEDWDKLADIAEELGISRSALARLAIKREIVRQKKRLGL